LTLVSLFSWCIAIGFHCAPFSLVGSLTSNTALTAQCIDKAGPAQQRQLGGRRGAGPPCVAQTRRRARHGREKQWAPVQKKGRSKTSDGQGGAAAAGPARASRRFSLPPPRIPLLPPPSRQQLNTCRFGTGRGQVGCKLSEPSAPGEGKGLWVCVCVCAPAAGRRLRPRLAAGRARLRRSQGRRRHGGTGLLVYGCKPPNERAASPKRRTRGAKGGPFCRGTAAPAPAPPAQPRRRRRRGGGGPRRRGRRRRGSPAPSGGRGRTPGGVVVVGGGFGVRCSGFTGRVWRVAALAPGKRGRGYGLGVCRLGVGGGGFGIRGLGFGGQMLGCKFGGWAQLRVWGPPPLKTPS
jgi:hypothetical protein